MIIVKQALIFHNSQEIAFRSPFGAVSCKQKILLKLRVESEKVPETVLLRIWQDGVGETITTMEQMQVNGDCRTYQVQISAPSNSGVLWYYFMVTLEGIQRYYGNNAAILGGIGQIYDAPPPSYQITVFKKGLNTPNWFKEAVMYQIFPDRFYNGEPDGKILNPKKGSVIHSDWGNTPYYIRDVDTKRIVSYDFFGGNLRGVMAKLSYLKELGISVIYFNPIFEAASNHRYDTGDYKKIDPMLGDNQLFAELCAKARKLGITVILDGVFSHTGSDSVYFNREGRYLGTGAYQSPDSPYYKWYRFIDYPNVYESWWGIDTLPNVEETEPSYVDFIIEGEDSVVKYWLKQGTKGWRLDVVDELPEQFVKKLYKTLKAADPEAVLIGEVWEDASRKTSYGQLRQYLQGEELDSVMNYPLRKALLDFVLGYVDAQYTHQVLMSMCENYPKEIFYALMNFLGTHDVPRVLTLLGEAPPDSELSIAEQAQYRLSAKQKELAIARLKMLVLWQMTFPGVPCIYYGDEAGVEGYIDPFNRGTYPWDHEDGDLQAWYRQIIGYRNKYDALRTGQWIIIKAEADVYAYVRRIVGGRDVFGQIKADNTFLVAFNRNKNQALTVELDVRPWCRGSMIDVLNKDVNISVKSGKIVITLQPLEGKLLLQVEKSAFKRECGVLLHPTSLPSQYGIGDLGEEAYDFINFLHEGKQKNWQILPLNPVGFGESPYQCLSAFAGNHYLISLDRLVKDGLLSAMEVKAHPIFDQDKVNFDKVKIFKEELLRRAFCIFGKQEPPAIYGKFVKENSSWLDNYALFMTLKQYFGGRPWNLWPKDIASRVKEAVEYYQKLLAPEINYHRFLQYVFFTQWSKLKHHAKIKKVKIIGDLPIFVSYDSSDVWSNPELFELDEERLPVKVAGVPPDYFSANGQLWGNPHYRWDRMAQNDYKWWRERFSILINLVDVIRIDHFRGFESYWEISQGETTAVNGRWVKGPGASFFTVMQKYLGELPIISEDLGIITPEVDDLKNEFYFPGMKVLHFAFNRDEAGECMPLMCEKNTAIYTGTHDNDTTVGWYKYVLTAAPCVAECVNKLLQFEDGQTSGELCWKLIEMAYASNANTVIIPMQDILCLGGEARMNFPGTIGDANWAWRCRKATLTDKLAGQLAELATRYNR
ncbi:bifunctional glycogen debranching protein GlgX/4-alpha-glucanotransferase [Pelorhabdus rhamnosifermentans]|uniref:bifunctional glycogen debranching protein GlgX/4-alpha-glucanotransferase n=1 Tax=Pelorhabdus rhamnosifermentans TaxID=2772457 RepID=UPI001C063520|nr:bifunctional glycogen debranching protein GlgX/4-alpha-glucanotransferase [Pelorhabdus rhamnosifermentans]